MGRVAVVTGGASGMGLAVGRRLAERGDRVALLASYITGQVIGVNGGMVL